MKIIGQPTSRIDGPVKVTGKARYAADEIIDGLLHGAIVTSTIASGRILDIDVSIAEQSPGVVRVFTHSNMPRLRTLDSPPAGDVVMPLQDTRVFYEGQPIALVVARTLEQARATAGSVRVTYRRESFQTDFAANSHAAEMQLLFGQPADAAMGDAGKQFANAAITIDQTYFTADRHHAPMEPSSTLAIWKDRRLVLRDAVQGVTLTRQSVAHALGIDVADVEVRCDFVGGGFGCKGYIWPHQLLAAAAARELNRPVRVTLARAQTFTGHGYQPASRQRVRLGAGADGVLTAIVHDSILAGSLAGNHVEPAGWGTRSLYACNDASTTHRVVRLNKGNPTPMRSPIEGVGLAAVEIAMDELAYAANVNPLQLRLRNYADVDAAHGRPFSAKKLRECYAEGARRFGWPERMPAPGALVRGSDLIGFGMASALFQTFRSTARARITLHQSGRVRVETGTQEIGGGTYTVLAQVAADALEVSIEQVDVVIGHTGLPEGPMSAGSRVTLSAGSAVQAAAENLRRRFAGARQSTAESYAEILRRLGLEQLAADGEWTPPQDRRYSIYSFGAVFVEVAVDRDIPIPRVRRVVAAYDAGRIVNPKTARSQMTGGIVWGIGQALLERSDMDHRQGRFLHKNLAGYLLPSNADVPDIDVTFIENFDAAAGPIGARGIGELGAIGIGPAIANAVFHASGRRVRSLPILPEMLLQPT